MPCHFIKRQPGTHGLREKHIRRSSAEPLWPTEPELIPPAGVLRDANPDQDPDDDIEE